MNVVGLFPTPLLIENIKPNLDMKEVDLLVEFSKQKENLIENIGNGNSFYKDTRILKILPNLEIQLTKKVNDFLLNIFGEHNSKLKITQSWLNINPKNSYHHMHSHKNSILSGVLYIECDENSGAFKLYKPEALCRDIGGIVNEHNPFTYDFVKFVPNKFDLYLFPSNLKHSVDTNESTTNRLSLAFNTFYIGEVDTISDSLSQLTITECS
jgi:uncharacterized protein (TIGR02466 family)